ncbi:SsrA-binding protein SmpB [Candidatus Oleimmundimicrobium sp.]|uniref:SsrA-binding protein SmpB n=1 Tax=Candidatus Oleimmundimicrobium sp. TaxID=3060597 RepID=UPI002728717F|nr:SsrA-binding protein SmpB [Candidatus Oleimmundimicrobium sp.]MDO8885695.1 SsrA-binding protein SmpB [Candidatus Oleimmundimicrobium sp.]
MAKNKIVAQNKKAYHDYFIDETYEAGLVLQGNEVKSIRVGKISLKESFAHIKGNEIFLHNMHISPYTFGRIEEQDSRRTRKLLLRKMEIKRLIGKTKEKGYTIIPLKVYFSNNFVKIELGLARGKKLYDKRKTIAEKTAKREVERALKERLKGRR